MRRWILFISAFLSSLCLLTALVLWPVSHFRWLHLEYKKPNNTSYTLSSHTGRVQFSYARSEISAWPVGPSLDVYPVETPHRWSYFSCQSESSPRLNRTTILGVMWLHDPAAPPFYCVDLAIPCAYLAMLFAILPACAIVDLRRRKMTQSGLCSNCSYDLRAHRPGEKCPECGTPIPLPAAAGRPVDLKLEP